MYSKFSFFLSCNFTASYVTISGHVTTEQNVLAIHLLGEGGARHLKASTCSKFVVLCTSRCTQMLSLSFSFGESGCNTGYYFRDFVGAQIKDLTKSIKTNLKQKLGD